MVELVAPGLSRPPRNRCAAVCRSAGRVLSLVGMTSEQEPRESPLTEAEALMEVAKAIRDLPAENLKAKRTGLFQPKGSIQGLMETLADLNDPKTVRQLQRERAEEERSKRAEHRANISIVISAVVAIGSVLAAVLH